MTKGPQTLLELQERFPDEEACMAFLRAVRWPEGFVCPRCEGRSSWTLRTRRLEQCRRCRHQTSLTAGAVLHRTRLPLRVWLWAIYFVGRHKTGISALQLQKDLGLGSYQTAWTLLHKLRSALAEPASRRLEGGDEFVGTARCWNSRPTRSSSRCTTSPWSGTGRSPSPTSWGPWPRAATSSPSSCKSRGSGARRSSSSTPRPGARAFRGAPRHDRVGPFRLRLLCAARSRAGGQGREVVA